MTIEGCSLHMRVDFFTIIMAKLQNCEQLFITRKESKLRIVIK